LLIIVEEAIATLLFLELKNI